MLLAVVVSTKTDINLPNLHLVHAQLHVWTNFTKLSLRYNSYTVKSSLHTHTACSFAENKQQTNSTIMQLFCTAQRTNRNCIEMNWPNIDWLGLTTLSAHVGPNMPYRKLKLETNWQINQQLRVLNINQ